MPASSSPSGRIYWFALLCCRPDLRGAISRCRVGPDCSFLVGLLVPFAPLLCVALSLSTGTGTSATQLPSSDGPGFRSEDCAESPSTAVAAAVGSFAGANGGKNDSCSVQSVLLSPSRRTYFCQVAGFSLRSRSSRWRIISIARFCGAGARKRPVVREGARFRAAGDHASVLRAGARVSHIRTRARAAAQHHLYGRWLGFVPASVASRGPAP